MSPAEWVVVRLVLHVGLFLAGVSLGAWWLRKDRS